MATGRLQHRALLPACCLPGSMQGALRSKAHSWRPLFVQTPVWGLLPTFGCSSDAPVLVHCPASPSSLRPNVATVQVVNAACQVCKKSIESAKGKLSVKEAARAVSERDDRLLAERMEALEAANREVSVLRVLLGAWVGLLQDDRRRG